jgi:hypothetical protein
MVYLVPLPYRQPDMAGPFQYLCCPSHSSGPNPSERSSLVDSGFYDDQVVGVDVFALFDRISDS